MNGPYCAGYLAPVTPDWSEWHRKYDDPSTGHPQRLAVVVEQIRAALDRAGPGPVELLSLCAGDGRDVVTAATAHPRAADLTGCLVELDDRAGRRGPGRPRPTGVPARGPHGRRRDPSGLGRCRTRRPAPAVRHLRERDGRGRRADRARDRGDVRAGRDGDLDAAPPPSRPDPRGPRVVRGRGLHLARVLVGWSRRLRRRRRAVRWSAAPARSVASAVHLHRGVRALQPRALHQSRRVGPARDHQQRSPPAAAQEKPHAPVEPWRAHGYVRAAWLMRGTGISKWWEVHMKAGNRIMAACAVTLPIALAVVVPSVGASNRPAQTSTNAQAAAAADGQFVAVAASDADYAGLKADVAGRRGPGRAGDAGGRHARREGTEVGRRLGWRPASTPPAWPPTTSSPSSRPTATASGGPQHRVIQVNAPNNNARRRRIRRYSIPGLMWNEQRVNMTDAWKVTAGDPAVTVGVADTGLDYTHSELAPKVVHVVDFTDDRGPADLQDVLRPGDVGRRLGRHLRRAGQHRLERPRQLDRRQHRRRARRRRHQRHRARRSTSWR